MLPAGRVARRFCGLHPESHPKPTGSKMVYPEPCREVTNFWRRRPFVVGIALTNLQLNCSSPVGPALVIV